MKINVKTLGMFVICIIVGTCLTIQTKVNDSEHAFVSAKVITDNEISAASEQKEIKKLNEIISETRKKLELYESEEFTNKDITEKVEKDYKKSKQIAGYSQLKGPGITIFLDDGVRNLHQWENANNIIVHDLDLMVIIDELVKAGAEAISINGERYISTTEIACSGHTVKINGRTHARPFYINVIGDQSTLYSAMTIPGGYGDILAEYGLVFNVEKSDSVIIPAYKGSLEMNYIILNKEGE